VNWSRVSFLCSAIKGCFDLKPGIYREVPGIRIPGGSEDVMMDLGVRQLVKNFKNKTKALERPSGSSKL
jgi:acyl-CoA dehydrogenase